MGSRVATLLLSTFLAASEAQGLPNHASPGPHSSDAAASTERQGAASGQGTSGSGEDPVRTIFIGSDRALPDASEDVANLLQTADQRQRQRDSLLPVSPIEPLRAQFERANRFLDETISLRLGIASNNLYQLLSDRLPDEDRQGVASDFDVFGTLRLIRKDTPSQGQVFFQVEGRWDYGTTGPSTLGVTSLGSLVRTADSFERYSPPFLPLRNLYWQQGGAGAGWTYRAGKITPDQILGVSRHLNPFATFHPTGTVATNQPYPDSGLGTVGAWYFGDRAYVLGLISDANADRQNWGQIGDGDFYKAVELGFKINPQTEQSGYSKITIGHTDGTNDGLPANIALGPSGWGISGKWEQELSADGRAVGILKYGGTTNGSSFYTHLASAHFLLYDPPDLPGPDIVNDLLGVGVTWAEPAIPDTRDETIVEVFYMFPLFPQVDITLGYQSVFDPALDRGIDHAHVFNLRLRSTF